jgi:hypothetical protein
VVDPEDPLYGLDLRLKYSKLDESVLEVIKAKLKDAKERIRVQLEER